MRTNKCCDCGDSAQVIIDKLNEDCTGNPIKVEICNPVDLTAIETALNNILTEAQAINANTDGIEAQLAQVITDIQAGNVTLGDIEALLNTIRLEVEEIDGNTDTLENLIPIANNILTEIGNEGDQTQALLTQIRDKLLEDCAGSPLQVQICNPTDLTAVQALLTQIRDELEQIDINTDGIEGLIAQLIADINTGNSTLTSILSQLTVIRAEVENIDDNTDGIEALLTNIFNEVNDEGDETQALLTSILTELQSHPQVEVATLCGQPIGGGASFVVQALYDEVADSWTYTNTAGAPLVEGVDFEVCSQEPVPTGADLCYQNSVSTDMSVFNTGVNSDTQAIGGVDVTIATSNAPIAPGNPGEILVQLLPPQPDSNTFTLSFSQPVENLILDLRDVDLSGQVESLDAFSQFPDNCTGQLDCTSGTSVLPTANNADGTIEWNGPIQSVNFTVNTTSVNLTSTRAIGISLLRFDVNCEVVELYNPASGAITYIDRKSGNPVTGIVPTACCNCSTGGDTSAPSAFDPVSHTITAGTTSPIPAGLKSVRINSLTGTTVVDGVYELGGGRRDTSLTLSATESGRVDAVLPSITLAGGTFQWIALDNVEV